jgi:hypothetical protein
MIELKALKDLKELKRRVEIDNQDSSYFYELIEVVEKHFEFIQSYLVINNDILNKIINNS